MILRWIDRIIDGIIGGIIAGTIVAYYSNKSNYNIWILPLYVIGLVLIFSFTMWVSEIAGDKKLKNNPWLGVAFLGIIILAIYIGFKLL